LPFPPELQACLTEEKQQREERERENTHTHIHRGERREERGERKKNGEKYKVEGMAARITSSSNKKSCTKNIYQSPTSSIILSVLFVFVSAPVSFCLSLSSAHRPAQSLDL